MSISGDNLHPTGDVLTTRTHSSLRKQQQQENRKESLLYSREMAHLWSFHSTQTGGWLCREKVLDRFLLRILQANNDFFSCSCDFESVFAIIVSAKEAVQWVFRIPVECLEQHPGTLPGAHETRTLGHVCCQALAAVLPGWSWRPLASTGFELPYPWCDVNRRAL